MVLAFHSRFVAKSRKAAFSFNEGIWVSVKIGLHLVPCLPDNLGIHDEQDRAGWRGEDTTACHMSGDTRLGFLGSTELSSLVEPAPQLHCCETLQRKKQEPRFISGMTNAFSCV